MTFVIGKLAIQVMKCIELLISYQGEEKYTENLITSQKDICKSIELLQNSPCNEVYLRCNQFIKEHLGTSLIDCLMLDEEIE